MGTSVALILKLSLALAVLYGLVIVVWYELLRSAVSHRRAAVRRRAVRRGADSSRPRGPRLQAGAVEREAEAASDRVAMESELERARRHYQLARSEARAERDAAIGAANQAAEQAVERIEARYREIDGAFIEEETERILELLRRPPGGRTR